MVEAGGAKERKDWSIPGRKIRVGKSMCAYVWCVGEDQGEGSIGSLENIKSASFTFLVRKQAREREGCASGQSEVMTDSKHQFLDSEEGCQTELQGPSHAGLIGILVSWG